MGYCGADLTFPMRQEKFWGSSVLLAGGWDFSKWNTDLYNSNCSSCWQVSQGILHNLLPATQTFGDRFWSWAGKEGNFLRKHLLKYSSGEAWVGWAARSCTSHPNVPCEPNASLLSRLTWKRLQGRSSLLYICKYTEAIWSIRMVISLQRCVYLL